nr:PREDICTED: colorectal mutant cancer protein [Bemisia tabaci]
MADGLQARSTSTVTSDARQEHPDDASYRNTTHDIGLRQNSTQTSSILQETLSETLLQLINDDDDHEMTYADFIQNHLNASGSGDGGPGVLKQPQNIPNTNGRPENLEFHKEAQDLQSEAKCLQLSLEKVAQSLAALQLKTSENKELQESNLNFEKEGKIAELHDVIAELSGRLRCQSNLSNQGGNRIPEVLSDCRSNVDTDSVQNGLLESQIIELKQLMRRKDTEIEELHAALSMLSSELEYNKHQRCDTKVAPGNQVPILKVAERIKLKTMDRPVTGYLISNLGVSRTEVAEHLVSDLKENCDIQELKEKHELEVEMERLNAKLEHIRSQNALLQLNFDESKSHCTRLSILIGKYESNIIALKQALDKSNQIIDIYRTLRDAKKSPKHKEEKLMSKLSKLQNEQNSLTSTVVKLESHVGEPPANLVSVTEARKLDIETAVLMQELMAMREEKAELKAQLFRAEKEREQLELKLFSQQLQYQALAQSGAETCDRGDAAEIRLKERLKEVALTLDRVTRNAEMKQRQLSERVNQLKTVNAVLAHSLDKCNQKLQTRVRKVETQMLSMAERHAAQVGGLKQNIMVLEDKVAGYEGTVRALETELEAWRKPRS